MYPLEQFQQINSLDDEVPIYQLRIFNLEARKDVLYETFFERALHCQRQDIYSLTAKNNRGILSNAITTLLDELVLMNSENIFYLGNQFMEAIEPMKDLSKIID